MSPALLLPLIYASMILNQMLYEESCVLLSSSRLLPSLSVHLPVSSCASLFLCFFLSHFFSLVMHYTNIKLGILIAHPMSIKKK